jgi:2-polyprenyl-6-methoxyphenol hydroxylase-like FAD-dependent oxidoreductase
MPEQHDVVVVGAGPVGLSLALGLARRGRDVLVLETNDTTAEHSRAPAIWPGTQEVLADLGVIDRFEAHGLIVPAPEMWDADHDRPILRIPIDTLADETRFPRLLIIPQSRTERLLSEALGETATGRVRWAAEVLGAL